MKVFYDKEYNGVAYDFDTTRKAAPIAERLKTLGLADIVEPGQEWLDEAERLITELHSPDYVAALKGEGPGVDPHKDRWLAESSGLDWDKGTWPMAVHSTAGVLAAANAALIDGAAGSLSSGLHHARPEWGAGYCTVNGLAMAAKLMTEHGKRVTILDLDAHCGGGTYESLDHLGLQGYGLVHHLDLATNVFDDYVPEHPDQLAFWDYDEDQSGYLHQVHLMLDSVRWEQTDIVLYNAGMDPFDEGIMPGTLAAREDLVFETARDHDTPIAWVLAGGYTSKRLDMNELVDLHLLTAAAA